MNNETNNNDTMIRNIEQKVTSESDFNNEILDFSFTNPLIKKMPSDNVTCEFNYANEWFEIQVEVGEVIGKLSNTCGYFDFQGRSVYDSLENGLQLHEIQDNHGFSNYEIFVAICKAYNELETKLVA